MTDHAPKPKVYVETSVISYLTARPSRNLIVAAHQQITAEWWRSRGRFDLFVSEAVIEEAAAGDPDAAARRVAELDGIAVLVLSPAATELARRLLAEHAVPAKAVVDAVHIAIAATNGIDFLLTWNCKHIANAFARGRIQGVCRSEGAAAPAICTPEELSDS